MSLETPSASPRAPRPPCSSPVPLKARSTLSGMQVKIDPGTHIVEVEGVDISRAIRRTTVDLHAGRPADVFLEVAAGCLVPETLEVDGVVHVVRDAADLDHRSIVMAWLESVDASALEAAVLADADLAQSTGQAFLTELAKLAANG